MAAAIGVVEETIREYLLYRGFVQTLKSFDLERKEDKDKGLRVSSVQQYGVVHGHLYFSQSGTESYRLHFILYCKVGLCCSAQFLESPVEAFFLQTKPGPLNDSSSH